MVEPLLKPQSATGTSRKHRRQCVRPRGAAMRAGRPWVVPHWPEQTCPRLFFWQMTGDYIRNAKPFDTRESPRQRFSTCVKNRWKRYCAGRRDLAAMDA